MTLWTLAGLAAVGYLALTLALTVLVHRLPRHPVVDAPDWGEVLDTRVPARGGGFLEVWRILPEGPVRGTVVMIHGWGRNRDRMVARARHFARLGMMTVLFSARDHGRSSRFRFMNAAEFAADALAVMRWLDYPVILYGHSAGAGGAIIAASRRPRQVALLFLEACYADTREGLLSLYRWFNPVFGRVCGPMILNWMNLMYRFRTRTLSPERLAPGLPMPVMVIHGAEDRRFPVRFARRLYRAFPEGRARLLVVPGAGHSDSSTRPPYGEAVADFLAARGEACAATIPPAHRTRG